MAKYLVKVSYNTDNIKDLLKKGATDRRKIVEELIAAIGGKLESFYYTFGDYGVFCVSDIADNLTAADLTTSLNKSGLVQCSTTLLISEEDIEKEKNKKVYHSLPAR